MRSTQYRCSLDRLVTLRVRDEACCLLKLKIEERFIFLSKEDEEELMNVLIERYSERKATLTFEGQEP